LNSKHYQVGIKGTLFPYTLCVSEHRFKIRYRIKFQKNNIVSSEHFVS